MDPASDAAREEFLEKKLSEARTTGCPDAQCGGKRSVLVKIDSRWHMKCPYCKMTGPGSFVREHAVDAWMRLPRRPETPEIEVPERTCEIQWCGRKSSEGVTVYETVGDAPQDVWICRDCAEKLGLKNHGDLPDAETVKRLIGKTK
jgi:hypothetical protein